MRSDFSWTNVKIQLWNLGFVEAHQSSILRGQGFCLHEVAGKGTRPSPTGSWHASRVEGRNQRFTSRDKKKAVKESSTVVAMLCDRFPAHPP